MKTLEGLGKGEYDQPFEDPDEITRPEGVNRETSWGRMASLLSLLSDKEARDATALLIDWQKTTLERRIILSAIAREFRE